MRRWRKDWRASGQLSRPNGRCAAQLGEAADNATASFVAFAVMASFKRRLLRIVLFVLAVLSGALPGRPGSGRDLHGVAAPRFVPGPWPRYALRRECRCRLAAWQRMGDVANDGTEDPSTSAMISRMLVCEPPGVFRRRITTSTRRSPAVVSASFTYWRLPDQIAPSSRSSARVCRSPPLTGARERQLDCSSIHRTRVACTILRQELP